MEDLLLIGFLVPYSFPESFYYDKDIKRRFASKHRPLISSNYFQVDICSV